MSTNTGDYLDPLYPYQEWGTSKIVQLHRTGVIAPPGAGKTRILLHPLRALNVVDSFGDFPNGPVLVICSGPAVATWKRQARQWLNISADDIHVVSGQPHKRARMWKQARESMRGFYIANSAIFYRDFDLICLGGYSSAKPPHWGAVLADEYHKFMIKRSKTWERFRSLVRHVPILLLCTGSPITKDPSSMYTLFALIDPNNRLFTSYWRFVGKFCRVIDGAWGKEIVGVKNIDELRALIDRYLVHIPEEVVADQLPEGRRASLYVDMTPEQAKIYSNLVESLLHITDTGEVIYAATAMNVVWQLKKLLCCPKLLDPSLGYGAGFEAILDRLEADPHVVIFVPFREACDWVKEGLESAGFESVVVLRGQIGTDEQTRALKQFRDTRGIAVCTIDYGESFDMETCKTSYFLGYSFTVKQNRQAEGRTRRAISEHQYVAWNYIWYSDTIDETFLENLNQEQRTINAILHTPERLIQAIKGEQA